MASVPDGLINQLQVTVLVFTPDVCVAWALTIKTPGIRPPTNQMPPGPGIGAAPVFRTPNWIGDGSAPGAMVKSTSPIPSWLVIVGCRKVENAALTPGYALFSFTAPKT